MLLLCNDGNFGITVIGFLILYAWENLHNIMSMHILYILVWFGLVWFGIQISCSLNEIGMKFYGSEVGSPKKIRVIREIMNLCRCFFRRSTNRNPSRRRHYIQPSALVTSSSTQNFLDTHKRRHFTT
jgi:hypothetical protein